MLLNTRVFVECCWTFLRYESLSSPPPKPTKIHDIWRQNAPLSLNWPPFHWQRSTLPETNIAPENEWLGYFLVSFEDGLKIQVLLLLVLGSVFLVKKLHDSFGRISCHVELELFSANNCTCARYGKWTPEENRIEDRSHSLHLTWLFLSFFFTRYWQLTIMAKSSMWLSTFV